MATCGLDTQGLRSLGGASCFGGMAEVGPFGNNGYLIEWATNHVIYKEGGVITPKVEENWRKITAAI
jgi:hypothetical protein